MRVPLHVVEARRERLARMLREHQYLPLAEVCARLGVSEATARRDLQALAEARAITRTRGGAISEYNRRFPSFLERLDHAAAGKRQIARAARARVAPGQVVWLDGGTTCHLLARALVESPVSDLTVVTNNLPAADVLAAMEGVAVHLLGGQYLRRSALLVGADAAKAVARWSFDGAFLGAEGLTADGFWNSLGEVADLQRAVMRAAHHTYVCLDATKVGRPAAVRLCGVEDVDHLITDAPARALARAGVSMAPPRLVTARAAIGRPERVRHFPRVS